MSDLGAYIVAAVLGLFAIYTFGSIANTVLVNKRLELLARAIEKLKELEEAREERRIVLTPEAPEGDE